MAGKIQNADIKSEAELVGLGADKTQLLNTTKMYSPKTTNVLENDLRKNNDAAIVAPAVTNDSSQGYEPGSRWVDTVGQKAYTCVSASVGAAIWKAGGEGGIGGVDIVAAQTAEDAVLGDFTQTGLEIIDTPIILHGKKSFRLIHQAASTRSFKQIIPVDSKFRGKAVTFEVDVVSSALMANLTLLIYNETAAANIAASQQIQTDSQSITATTTSGTTTLNGMTAADFNKLKLGMLITGPGIASGTRVDGLNASTLTATLSLNATSTSASAKSISALTTKRKISFMIPEGCKSLSYTFSALQEANFPETYLDDIVIQLAQYSLASTNISIPVQSPPTVTKILSGSGIYNVPANASYIRVRMVGGGGGGGGNSNNGTNNNYTGGTGGNTTFADMIAYGGSGGGTHYPGAVGLATLGAVAKGSIFPGQGGNPNTGYNATGSSGGTNGGSSIFGGGGNGGSNSGNGAAALANTGAGGGGAGGMSYSTYNYGAVGGSSGGGIDAVILSPSSSYSYSIGSGGAGAGGNNTTGGNGGSGYIEITEYITTNTTSKVDLTSAMLVQQPDSSLIMNSGVLAGNQSALDFLNISQNVGSAIQYNSATRRFVAQEPGLYYASVTDETASAAQNNLFIFANVNGLDIQIAESDIPNAQYRANASGSVYLNVGDYIRFQASNSRGTGGNRVASISKEGSLKQLNLSSDSKIEIPTHELRFEGCSARGSVDTGIIKFDTPVKLKGDAWDILNTVANGTVITMKKAGLLNISVSADTGADLTLVPSLNQTNLTTLAPASERIITGYGDLPVAAAGIFVKIGDKIRVSSGTTPGANGSNAFNLSLVETQINAAFSNVLPQWSQSNSAVSVNTANGYGSTNNKIRRFSNVPTNLGTAITYADSATLGASFTINEDDEYFINFYDEFNTADYLGISLNTTQPTAGIQSIPTSEILGISVTATSGNPNGVSWQGPLSKGDVVRPHNSSSPSAANPGRTRFTISKVGKPNLTSVDVSPFVNIKTMDSQSSRFVGTANNASTATRIYYFGTVGFSSNDNNGIYKLENSSVNGMSITILKDCEISGFLSGSTNNRAWIGWSINAPSLTADYTSTASQFRLSGALIETSLSSAQNSSFRIKAKAGDVIRPHIDSAATILNTAHMTLTATADNQSTASPTQQVSSDAIPFVFKATTIDPNTDSVGTYNTYSKQANIGASLILNGTAPTQTSSSMNADGVLVYSANITGTTSAAQPSRFDVFIGKGLKSKQVDAYAAAGKLQSIMTDYINNQSGTFYGTKIVYNEKNGILTIDSDCISGNATATRFVGLGIDGVGATSGYFVFNASKSPSLVTIPNLNKKFANIYNKNNTQASFTGGVWTTIPLNTLNDSAGIVTSLVSNQITLQPGTYKLSGSMMVYNSANSVQTGAVRLYDVSAAALISEDVGTVISYPISATYGGCQPGELVFNEVVFILTSQKTVALQFFSGSSAWNDGAGASAPGVTAQIRTKVGLEKIK